MTARVPIVDYLVIDDGEPYLLAHEAVGSGALSFTRRNADPVNGTPGFSPRRLATAGTVRAFTVVHRDAPGIEVPISMTGEAAIITTLKTTGP